MRIERRKSKAHNIQLTETKDKIACGIAEFHHWMSFQAYSHDVVIDVKRAIISTRIVNLQWNCNEALTSGRLRAPTAVAGLNSGPRGMRMLCS